MNIFQMYVENGLRYGFYVRRNSWPEERYAKVVAIGEIQEGEKIKDSMIRNRLPYSRLKLTLEADWFWNTEGIASTRHMGSIQYQTSVINGRLVTNCGGDDVWNQVKPK